MPAGVSWGQYLLFSAAAMLSMVTGSQVVHLYYKPLMDLNVYIKKELENLPKHVQEEIVNELKDEGVLS